METKICRTCQQELPISQYHTRSTGKPRLDCKECHRRKCRQYSRQWYLDTRGRADIKVMRETAHRNHINLHRDRYRARLAVSKAVKKGKLIKPTICQTCDTPTPRQHLHGHHTDYGKRLMVIWVCCRCHRVLERAKRLQD